MRATRILLEVDLTGELMPAPPSDLAGAVLARRRPALPSLLHRLQGAAADPRVVGLIAQLGGGHLGLATAQELAGAVAELRARGTATVAWAESYGEAGTGGASYLLASAFEEVWLQPSGEIALTGTVVTAYFLRAALDRLDVLPQLDRRSEYKNAANQLTETAFTAEHREASERLAESSYAQVVDAIARGRGLDPERVRALLDEAPIGAAAAAAAGLVDRVGYRDEAYAATRRRLEADGRVSLLFLDRHRGPHPLATRLSAPVRRRRQAVALITAAGPIRTGRGGGLPGRPAAGSDTVAGALRAARHDRGIAAVVLRVDSPGGSYVASDTIWREVVCCREAGKPVVVSMGSLAASGGYFISCAASRIVALPGTLTGSIGVFAGKLVLEGLRRRLGITRDAVAFGAHAQMFSTAAPFSEEEWAQLGRWLDAIYADFTAKVAQGRGMALERVHEVARGRVWTGADAAERGLVDELGGLPAAARRARLLAGLADDAPLRTLPASGPAAALSRPRNSERGASAAGEWVEWPGLAGLAAALGLPTAGPLLMAPLIGHNGAR